MPNNPRHMENLRAPMQKGEKARSPGRPKGSRNRATLVREWLDATEKIANPISGKEERLSQADIMTLALIKKARRGDVSAWNALMDSGFGKVADLQRIQGDQSAPVEVVHTIKRVVVDGRSG